MKYRYILILCCVLVGYISCNIFPYQFSSPPPGSTIQYDRTGKVIVGYKQDPYYTFDDIPQQLIAVLVAIEDKRFYSHPGIDPLAVLRAVRQARQGNGRQGASTIDQQLIKLDRQQFVRSRSTKLQENRSALRLQFHYGKKDILLRYINSIPFSHSIVGRKAACQSYRATSCNLLQNEQLLILLATAQLGANPYRETDRQRIIERAQFLGEHYVHLFSQPLNWSGDRSDKLHSFPEPIDPRVKAVLQTEQHTGVTSYDLALSNQIDNLLRTTKTQRAQYTIGDCCVIVLDNKGDLVSMNICRERDDPLAGKTNVCMDPRQTGSAIKPFLYLYAFQKLGLSGEATVVDEPVQFDLGGGNIYDPKNFDLTYHGEVTYAYALGNSLNVPAIKTMAAVGVAPFLHFLQTQLHRFSPNTPQNPKTAEDVGLSLALGTYELSPRQFTQLWRLFLPGQAPHGYELQRQAIVDILSTSTYKVVSFGQDSFLNTPGRAVKTGTSRNFIDGWICGVTTPTASTTRGFSVCIWLGNTTNTPMLGASSEVGSYVRSLVTSAITKANK